MLIKYISGVFVSVVTDFNHEILTLCPFYKIYPFCIANVHLSKSYPYLIHWQNVLTPLLNVNRIQVCKVTVI